MPADSFARAIATQAAVSANRSQGMSIAMATARNNDPGGDVAQIQIVDRGLYKKSIGLPTEDEIAYGWAFTDAGGTVWRKPATRLIRATEWGITAHTSFDANGTAIGQPVDQAPILNALCRYLSARVGNARITFDGLVGAGYLAASVKVPFGISFDGITQSNGANMTSDILGTFRFRPRADGVFRKSDGTTVSVAANADCREGILFWCNVDWAAPTTWVRPYPGMCATMENLYIDGSPTGGIKGFVYGGGYTFKRIRHYCVSTLIEKLNVYADMTIIEDVDGNYRADDASYYLLNLRGLGDAVRIHSVSSGYTISGAIPCNGLYLGGCAGGRVSGLINGIHAFIGCRGIIVDNPHLEDGQIIADAASITINAAWFNIGKNGLVPLVIRNTSGSSNLSHHRVTLNDATFIHFLNPLGAGGITGWDDVPTRLDIDIQSARMALTMNDGNRRVWSVSGQIDISHAMAVMIGDSTNTGGLYTDSNRRFANWMNYAHMLSGKTCTIMQKRVDVTGTMPERAINWGGIAVLAFTPVAGVTGVAYKGATGANTYLVRVLSDPVRLIGRASVPAGTVTIPVTNGASTLPGFRIVDSTQSNRGWTMFEVYRDTGSTGNFDKRVLIAGANLDAFVDDGNALNSFAWEPFGPSASAITLNNPGMSARATYDDNIITVRNSLSGAASGIVGTWAQGDQILRESFTPDAFGIKRIGSYSRTGGTPGTWDELNVGTGGSANKTWDPPSVPAQSGGIPGSTSTTVTATGVVMGDTVAASFSLALGGLRLVAEVTAPDTVTCTLINHTAAAIDIASGTLRVRKLL